MKYTILFLGDGMDTVGVKLKRIRLELGLTQGEMGDKLGVSNAQISRYENDNVVPDILTIQRYMKISGLDANYFLGKGKYQKEYEHVIVNNEMIEIYQSYCELSKDVQVAIKAILNAEYTLPVSYEKKQEVNLLHED